MGDIDSERMSPMRTKLKIQLLVSPETYDAMEMLERFRQEGHGVEVIRDGPVEAVQRTKERTKKRKQRAVKKAPRRVPAIAQASWSVKDGKGRTWPLKGSACRKVVDCVQRLAPNPITRKALANRLKLESTTTGSALAQLIRFKAPILAMGEGRYVWKK